MNTKRRVEKLEAAAPPLWRVELVTLLKDGKVTPQQVREELNEAWAVELCKEAGVDYEHKE